MSTKYQIDLDRGACEGIFACLVRDDRFVEAADGLTAFDDGIVTVDDGVATGDGDGEHVVTTFDDDRIEEAKQAAAACPVDAITVREKE